MAATRPQSFPSPPSNQLWQQRTASFIPPTRMSNPPVHQFTSSPNTDRAPQEETKPQTNRRTSALFSFGRGHKSTPSQGSIPTTSQLPANGSSTPSQQQSPQSQPPNPLQSGMNGYPMGNTVSQQQPQQQYQQQPTPQQQPPQSQPQAAVNGNGAHQPDPSVAETQRTRSDSQSAAQPQPPPLHPELRSFVSLSFAHVHKIYFSGPLVRKIERTPDSNKPKDDQWVDVWGQLGGTTLSLWDMKEIESANKEGREVPPSYINVTDAFVSVLGAITVPQQGAQPPRRVTNVLTINTAGSNLILFSCPDTASLISWSAALRLAAWEKSRLEEIYTAHLLRMTLSDQGAWKEPKTTLVRGQMEGWAQVRVAGQTDWKRVWIVLAAATPLASAGANEHGVVSHSVSRGKRISSLFSSGGNNSPPVAKSALSLYLNTKAKDKRRPWLTLYDVTQAFAVYPERPEMISKSTLVKVEGQFSDEEGAGNMRGREGWVFIMPEMENVGGRMGVMEMLKWIVGVHDAFDLYGRPRGYTWDPRDHVSMMFAYPFGPLKDHLFLDRELAETLDPRDERTSSIRSKLLNVLVERMQGPPVDPNATPDQNGQNGRLPPLHFGGGRQGQSLLTPITERSSIPTRENTLDGHLDQISSPGDADSQLRGLTLLTNGSQSPMNVSPNLAAAATAIASGQPNGSAVGPNAVAPSDPVAATRPSQAFESSLPSIPGSTGASPAVTPGPVKMPLGEAAAASSEQKSADRVLSPQSFARSLWNDTGLTSPTTNVLQNAGHAGVTSTDTYTAPSATPPLPQPVRKMSQGSFERPPSFSNVLRSQSPLRQSTTSSGPSVTSPQQVTSPLSHAPPLPPVPTTLQQQLPPPGPPPPAGPSASGGLPPSYAGSSQYPTEKETQQGEADIASPIESHHSYPAGAEMQTPDLIEPQPKPSRSSHTVLNAPFMNYGDSSNQPSQSQPRQAPPAVQREDSDLSSEPAALLALQYQQQMHQQQAQQQAQQQMQAQSKNDWGHARNLSGSSTEERAKPSKSHLTAVANDVSARRPTPLEFGAPSSPPREQALSPNSDGVPGVPAARRPSQVHVQRRPSGARAPPAKKIYTSNAPSVDLHSLAEDAADLSEPQTSPAPVEFPSSQPVRNGMDDYGADALRALTLAEENDQSRSELPPPPSISGAPETRERTISSSFGNKAAADRKAKALANQQAAAAAASKPGRVNGKGKKKTKNNAWGAGGSSDDDEEDEEDDDDDDADSDGPAPVRSREQGPAPYQQGYPQQQFPSGIPPNAAQNIYGSGRGTPPGRLVTPPGGRPLPSPDYAGQQRASRGLPTAPDSRSSSAGIPRDSRAMLDAYGQPTYNGQGHGMTPPPGQRNEVSPGPRGRVVPPQLQKSLWNQALDPDTKPAGVPGGRDTFIKMENESETMTKVFAPSGLLAAGLADKHDRSAKRQEDLARESGTSLINVPNRPPDPQTGLLGAVTAHERDRKKDGGIGATLTKKLADERMAEERQRKLDEIQRQQLDQAMMNGAGGGSMYGGMYGDAGQMQMGNPSMLSPGTPFGYPNPMMYNPMMMGGMGGMGMMGNPMMMGGGMGMMSQQQMWAAQQAAAEAYQKAMISFSQAGSRAGSQAPSEAGDVSPGSRMGAASPLPGMGSSMGMMNPMMMGGMGGMGMMGNPMMMGGMGMMPGMNGMGGMGMGGSSPAGMPGSPGMFPQYSGLPTPSTDMATTQGRFTPYSQGTPDSARLDQSANTSETGHQNPRPDIN